MAHACLAQIKATKVPICYGYLRTFTTPINVVIAYEHSVSLGIIIDISYVWCAIWMGMMRVQLAPLASSQVPRIDIISKSLFFASSKNRVKPNFTRDAIRQMLGFPRYFDTDSGMEEAGTF